MTSGQLLSLWVLTQMLVIEAKPSTPLILSPRQLPQGNGVCPSEEQLEAQRNNINSEVADLLRQYLQDCDVGMTAATAVSSCADVPSSCQSGLRYVMTADGKEEQVYCETNPPFDSGSSWLQLANLDMDNPGQTCPSGWTEGSLIDDTNVNACGRDLTQEQSVATAIFSPKGISWSKVCGRITAYQLGATEAFTTDTSTTLTDVYVDGVSITHSSYSEHIWTFAAARAQGDATSSAVCPCTNPTLHQNASIYVPSFVGEDYFCETGVSGSDAFDSTFYANYLLWDGLDCFGSSTCCQFNSPPWFCKTLPAPTAQDIEVRIMNFASEGHKIEAEDTLIEKFYLYVQ